MIFFSLSEMVVERTQAHVAMAIQIIPCYFEIHAKICLSYLIGEYINIEIK